MSAPNESPLTSHESPSYSPLGYPTEDRPFSPHLTLGRARQDADRSTLSSLGEKIGKIEVGILASWRVEGVSLMRSDLKPSGAVYTQSAYTAFGKPPG